MKQEPIKRRKLSDEVRERLLQEIDEGRLPPGSSLPSERELMETFGVGRPTIREAMQSLQNLGLVHVRHGERPTVAEPQLTRLAEQLAVTMRHVLTYDETVLSQLKSARLIVEVELARIAARNRSEEQLADLRDILDRQAVAKAKGAEDFVQLDKAFHTGIGEMSGNFLLAAVIRAVFEWLERFHAASVRTAGLEALTLEEHERIFRCIADGNADAAGEAMNHHLSRANTLYRQDKPRRMD